MLAQQRQRPVAPRDDVARDDRVNLRLSVHLYVAHGGRDGREESGGGRGVGGGSRRGD